MISGNNQKANTLNIIKHLTVNIYFKSPKTKTMKTKIQNMLTTTLVIIIAGFIVFQPIKIFAGDDKIAVGEKILMQSKILGEERTILIHMPKGYELTKSSYPVLYLLDGDYHFLHTCGITEFLASQGIMPQVMVVAIANTDRTRDFTPTKVEKKENTGGAEKFMSFIADELMPYIQKNYNSLDWKILAGHSLGGTFTTYAFLNNPNLFDGYIAISPYLEYDDKILLKEADAKIANNYDPDKFFYMTLGNEPKFVESIESFAKKMQSKSPDGLEFTYNHLADEDHSSIPHLGIYNGLKYIYSDWKMNDQNYEEGLAGIDSHYQKLSQKYGYKIETPEYIVNLLGYQYLGKNDFNTAIEVFRENVNRFPKSANVYDSLGEAYEKNGQMPEAEKNYKKAVEIAGNENHPYLKVYQDNLQRVEDILANK
jgi:predicted alpha/beta superfamily hydrolase